MINLYNLLNLNFSYEPSNEPSYDPSYDARDGRYEGYREQNLPEGYEAYGENGNAEAVYDRYEEDYDVAGTEEGYRRPKQSCCKRLRSGCSDMGRLIKSLNSKDHYNLLNRV